MAALLTIPWLLMVAAGGLIGVAAYASYNAQPPPPNPLLDWKGVVQAHNEGEFVEAQLERVKSGGDTYKPAKVASLAASLLHILGVMRRADVVLTSLTPRYIFAADGDNEDNNNNNKNNGAPTIKPLAFVIPRLALAFKPPRNKAGEFERIALNQVVPEAVAVSKAPPAERPKISKAIDPVLLAAAAVASGTASADDVQRIVTAPFSPPDFERRCVPFVVYASALPRKVYGCEQAAALAPLVAAAAADSLASSAASSAVAVAAFLMAPKQQQQQQQMPYGLPDDLGSECGCSGTAREEEVQEEEMEMEEEAKAGPAPSPPSTPALGAEADAADGDSALPSSPSSPSTPSTPSVEEEDLAASGPNSGPLAQVVVIAPAPASSARAAAFAGRFAAAAPARRRLFERAVANAAAAAAQARAAPSAQQQQQQQQEGVAPGAAAPFVAPPQPALALDSSARISPFAGALFQAGQVLRAVERRGLRPVVVEVLRQLAPSASGPW